MSVRTHQRQATPRTGPSAGRCCSRHWLVASVLGLCVVLLAACGGGGGTELPSSLSAVVGPAGATITGPDGVQVIVPAGALAQATTLSITRSSSGAPTPLPEDNSAASSVYEFLPHGLVFNKPVTIRMPVSGNAPGTAAFMASPGGDWQVNDTTVTGGVAEWQRNSFSFGMLPGFCAPSNSSPYSASQPDPYPCTHPRGWATASATPTSVITKQTSGNPFNSAGSWIVNQAGTVQMTLTYEAAPDCQNAWVKLIRWNPAISGGAVQPPLFDGPVTLTLQAVTVPAGAFATGTGTVSRGVGSTTVPVAFSHLDNGTNAFGFSFSCNRPYRPKHSGGDILTFIAGLPVTVIPPTIGGTVSGLTGSGLVLQNNGGDNLAVATDGSFTFATALNLGASYAVTVRTQPTGQVCTVASGGGTANASVTNVAVTCVSNAGPLALVANSGSNNLSILRVDASTGALTSVGTVSTGNYPYAVAVTPNGLFAYVGNLLSGTISPFSVNNSTGALTLIPLSSLSTQNPWGLTMDPLGQFLWVANYGFHTVSAFVIAANGVLTAAGSPVAASGNPNSIKAHPSGNFVYVGSDGTNALSVYSVNRSTGVLTFASSIANAASGPQSIAIHPTLNALYVTDSNGAVGAFNINAGTGALALIGYVNSGNSPYSVVVHPNGQYAYVANNGANTISIFSINQSTGALTQTGSPVATGTNPRTITFNTAGTRLYVTNYTSNSVSAFSIAGGGATLTSLGATVPSGTNPEGIAIAP